jgi:hypothetical protein
MQVYLDISSKRLYQTQPDSVEKSASELGVAILPLPTDMQYMNINAQFKR